MMNLCQESIQLMDIIAELVRDVGKKKMLKLEHRLSFRQLRRFLPWALAEQRKMEGKIPYW
jgi:hypothetical protein